MNNVVLIGRLTKDPEMSYTQTNQTARTTFTMAVDRPKRNGEDQGADFIRVVVWGRQAETCDRYLSKGRMVAVRGSIRTGSYENKIGNKVYTTDVFADNVQFLGGNDGVARNESREPSAVGYKDEYFADMPDTFSAADDDIPF